MFNRHMCVYLYCPCYDFIKKKLIFIKVNLNTRTIHFFYRKAKLSITREVLRQHHSHNSELNADINISEPPQSSEVTKVKKD